MNVAPRSKVDEARRGTDPRQAVREEPPRPDSLPRQGSSIWRGLLPSLVLNAALPYVLYQVLTARGVGTIDALAATAVFPLAGILVGWARTRRPDLLGLLSLVFIVVGIVTSFISDDPFLFLIKESLLTGAWALLCFGSLLLPRPLMFYFGRQFAGAGDPERAARYDALWQYPSFRFSQRLITVVWGCGLAVEALLRVVLALSVPIPLFLAISPPMGLVVSIGLAAWTVSYARRVARRAGSHGPADRSCPPARSAPAGGWPDRARGAGSHPLRADGPPPAAGGRG